VASGVGEALRLIEQQLPDFSLLDVNLGEETSIDIAERLAERGSPFAFTSGYGEPVAFPEKFSHVQRLRKPYSLIRCARCSPRPASAALETKEAPHGRLHRRIRFDLA
jgi:CheY-like chemotaxis protein